MTPPTAPIVVMGVSGCGKSTMGRLLADALGVPFGDADTLHSAENIAKMTTGHALDDSDRAPWLARVGQWLAAHPDGAVMACSALTRRYRDVIRGHCPDAVFVHLAGTPELVAQRLAGRPHHFMPATLLASQYATLEPLGSDEPGVTIDIDSPPDQLVTAALASLPAGQQDLT